TDQVSEQDAGISVDEPSRARPGAGAGPAMNLQPLADRLIVEVLEQEEATGSGIVLPDTTREKPQRGFVLAVGPGARDEHGKHIELDVAAGDEVVFSKYGGTEIKLGSDDVLILRESDVLAKVAAQTSKKSKRELAGATAHEQHQEGMETWLTRNSSSGRTRGGRSSGGSTSSPTRSR